MPAGLLVEDRPLEGLAGPGLRLLTLSHPTRRNAIDAPGLVALAAEAARATADGVLCLVLTGEGGHFCSGFDLHALDAAEVLAGALPDAPLGAACAALDACAPPVIAAVDGPAYGAGLEIACACDLRVAGSTARFCAPPARLGVVYAPDGAQRLARAVGTSQAKRMFLTATVLDAAEAQRIGLVEEVVEGPSLPRALALAEQIARLSPRSTAGMKQVLNALAAAPLTQVQRDAFEELRRAAFSSEDALEGRNAFLERRPPRFTGR